MADRPILMSGSMVAATMREIAQRGSGKSETRRCVTKGTTTMDGGPWCNFVSPSNFNLEDARADDSYPDSPILKMPWDNLGQDVVARLRPRIEAGDRLWVREAWRPKEGYGQWDLIVDYPADKAEIHLADDIYVGDWRFPKSAATGNVPSIHMPRWASRITLEVTDVQFERIQEITEEGARHEGIERDPETMSYWGAELQGLNGATRRYDRARGAFRDLWDGLNETRGFSWDSNPWVVVISFKPVLCNIDRMAEVAA